MITAINDEDRRRHFNNLNDDLLRRLRAIKNEQNYDSKRNGRRVDTKK